MREPTRQVGEQRRPAGAPERQRSEAAEEFIYILPPSAEHALAERAVQAAARARERARAAPPTPEEAAEEAARRSRRAARNTREAAARAHGRRLGTVSRRTRPHGGPVPDLRISGFWLRDAGFDFGQEYEVEVEQGKLTVRAVQTALRSSR